MMNLRLYDRNGTTLLGLLPQPVSYSASFEFSEVGALQFDYPVDGINASLITELREVALVNALGADYVNGRFVITSIDRERSAVSGTIKVTCRSILWRLDTALAYPDGGIGSGELSRYFDTKTAGYICKTLIDDAQTRGALAGLSYNFSATADSNSAAWGLTTTQEFPARNTILSVIRSLSDLGLVEVQTLGRQIQATKADGIGTDKSTGNSAIVLRYGHNLSEAPESLDASSIAGAVLVEGEGGLLVERTSSATVTSYGRLETSLTASGIDDTATVNALGDTYLTTLADANRQLTVGLTLQAGTPQPLDDFIPGDYVLTATTAGLERVRVRQITISMNDGAISASVTLGDRLYESDIRFARKLSGITSGSVQAGSGSLLTPQVTATFVNDGLAPSAPSSLTGTTAGYVEGIDPRAAVSLSWTNPTTNADATPLTDLGSIEVQMRRLSTDEWQFAATSYGATARITGLAVNTSHRFRVRAIDTAGNESAFSNEFVITTANLVATETTPSTPVLTTRLGTLSIDWDGLGAAGAAMSPTFSYLAVHVSTTTGFTPSAGTFVGRMEGADTLVLADLSYSTTYYVKFVAYNKAGTPSTASTQASATIVPLVNTDIIANTISGAKIQDGTLTASDKIIANTITGSLIQASAISADKIQANAITADKILAGAIDATKIAANAITADKIQAGAITTDKLTAGTLTGFTINNGSGTFSVSAAGALVATSGTIGGFTLSSTGLASPSYGWSLTSSGTLTGGNSNSLFYGYVNIGGGSAGSERLIVTGNSNFNGQAIFSGNVTSQTHFFSPFANNVTSAANGYWVSSSGRMTYTTASSQRYKRDITPLREVPGMEPEKLLDLPVRAFRYNEDYVTPTDDRADTLMPGFIAEEVDAIYPIAADYENGNVNSWNERMIVPGMLALIQDLTKEVASLKASLNGAAS